MDHIDNFSLTKLSFKKSKKKNSIDKYSKRELISKMISTKSYLFNYRNKIINSFILFGCWNHIDCCSKNSKFTPIYRDIIIKQAKKEPEKLFIIAGDNWYSQNYVYNNTSYKYYPFTTLTSGYSLLLNNSKKEYDIILGNHDENNDNINTDFIQLKKDCMLKVQKYVIQNIAKKNPIYKLPSLEELQDISINNMFINKI